MGPGYRINRAGVMIALAAALAVAVFGLTGAGSALRSALSPSGWGADFERVDIPSPVDGAAQPAYLYKSPAPEPRPLVVSLHEWSHTFAYPDPLAALVKAEGWHYIRPDFRGPNKTPKACLSDLALSDIEAAIDFARARVPVDPANIFIVGVSGGGYAALGAYLRLNTPIKAVLAWAAISDLADWYFQSRNKGTKYADDIIKCTSNTQSFCRACAEARSPLHMAKRPLPATTLEIYAGIHDGHSGSVPIVHSIAFFNKVAELRGDTSAIVAAPDIVRLLTRTVDPARFDHRIAGRAVYLNRRAGPVSVTIFEGGHEILHHHTIARLRQHIAR